MTRRAKAGNTGNRTDLAVTAPTGQPYGARHEQVAAQQAVPMGQANPAPRPMVHPEDVPDLFDATGRPGEPVTAGMAIGPGAGREALGYVPPRDEASDLIRAMYAVAPSPELERMLSRLNEEGR